MSPPRGSDPRRERRRLKALNYFETQAFARGVRLVGGIDEVGRGPLAGPVVAACVVTTGPLMLDGLDDSKVVRPQRRERLAEEIRAACAAWAIGSACVEEIDHLDIYRATLLAMERAVAALQIQPEYLLVDALRLASFNGEQQALVRGDSRCATIAAASILAKVYRDRLLVDLHARYPAYGFGEHKGYGTERHVAALRAYGPTPEHRRRFVETVLRGAPLLPGLDLDEES